MGSRAWVSHLIDKAYLLDLAMSQEDRAWDPDRQTHPIRKAAHLQILQERGEPQEAALSGYDTEDNSTAEDRWTSSCTHHSLSGGRGPFPPLHTCLGRNSSAHSTFLPSLSGVQLKCHFSGGLLNQLPYLQGGRGRRCSLLCLDLYHNILHVAN